MLRFVSISKQSARTRVALARAQAQGPSRLALPAANATVYDAMYVSDPRVAHIMAPMLTTPFSASVAVIEPALNVKHATAVGAHVFAHRRCRACASLGAWLASYISIVLTSYLTYVTERLSISRLPLLMRRTGLHILARAYVSYSENRIHISFHPFPSVHIGNARVDALSAVQA
jgi:hypothetical protein